MTSKRTSFRVSTRSGRGISQGLGDLAVMVVGVTIGDSRLHSKAVISVFASCSE